MKTQANDKDARRKRRASKHVHKTYGEKKPIKMDYYTVPDDTQEDLEAAVGSLNIPSNGDWNY